MQLLEQRQEVNLVHSVVLILLILLQLEHLSEELGQCTFLHPRRHRLLRLQILSKQILLYLLKWLRLHKNLRDEAIFRRHKYINTFFWLNYLMLTCTVCVFAPKICKFIGP